VSISSRYDSSEQEITLGNAILFYSIMARKLQLRVLQASLSLRVG
jgi:hypothetical protein